MTENTMLEWALTYARLGWHVFLSVLERKGHLSMDGSRRPLPTRRPSVVGGSKRQTLTLAWLAGYLGW